MEFDKSRVYTALNADELEVGSMVIVADSLFILRNTVKNADKKFIVKLTGIADEMAPERFCVNGIAWAFAYLVSLSKSKKTPKYKPFSNSETAYKTIAAHGRWLKMKGGGYLTIAGINIERENNEEILVGRFWHSAQDVFDACVFADDGSPVGEKIEDSDTEEDGAT